MMIVDKITNRTDQEIEEAVNVNVNINLYKKWKIIMYKFNGSSLLPCE